MVDLTGESVHYVMIGVEIIQDVRQIDRYIDQEDVRV